MIQSVKVETYLEYSHIYEQRMQSSNPKFSFHIFLNTLEMQLNAKRQRLAKDFSNYTKILTPEQIQELHPIIPQTEALNFLHTFFTIKLDTTAIFLFLLLSHWHELTSETVYSTFLDILDRSPLPSDFEFSIHYLDLPVSDQWLAVDIRTLLILALKYLAEHLHVYETLKKRCASWYEYVLQQQPT